MTTDKKAYRAAIVHSIADPAEVVVEASYEYFEDGLMVVENGKITAVGHTRDLLGNSPATWKW
jgi:guanine deaminase